MIRCTRSTQKLLAVRQGERLVDRDKRSKGRTVELVAELAHGKWEAIVVETGSRKKDAGRTTVITPVASRWQKE